MHGTGQRAEDPVVGEQLGRGGAVRRDAGVVLGRLLGQVHVQRPTRGGLDHRPQGVVGDGAHRVDGGPDHDVVVAFRPATRSAQASAVPSLNRTARPAGGSPNPELR